MTVRETPLAGVLVVEPRVHGDPRGYFKETYQRDRYREAGISADFLQDNVSRSARGVLRGMHLQCPGAQGKLVQALEGEIFDVAVDVRPGSPTFGRWFGEILSGDNHRQLWVPGGLAHGFLVLSDSALVAYKVDAPYRPDAEITLRYDDPEVGIAWPTHDVSLSEKDARGVALRDLT